MIPLPPNFQTIPKLVGMGGYSVTALFSDLIFIIEDYIKNEDLDLNPEFQREYVWNEAQKEAYVEFLLRDGRSSRDILFNCASWSKYDLDFDAKDPILNRMVIVDGKQRLNAVMAFLKNELKAFGYYKSEFGGTLRTTHFLTFHVNSLKTRKDILQWYLELNSGGTVHSDEELNKVRKMLSYASSK